MARIFTSEMEKFQNHLCLNVTVSGLQLCCVHVLSAAVGVAATVLTLPGDGRVEHGSSVVLQCSAQTNGTGSIVWYRRSGDVQYTLGVENVLHSEFGTKDRYKITRGVLSDLVVSNLTISGKCRSSRMMSGKCRSEYLGLSTFK